MTPPFLYDALFEFIFQLVIGTIRIHSNLLASSKIGRGMPSYLLVLASKVIVHGHLKTNIPFNIRSLMT